MGRAITDEGDGRVAAASFFNAKQQTGKAAYAVLGQTRYIDPSAANDARVVVRRVAGGTRGAIEEKYMGRGGQYAAGSGQMAVAADDRDAGHLRSGQECIPAFSAHATGFKAPHAPAPPPPNHHAREDDFSLGVILH